METVGVYSLDSALDLIDRRGEEEEVEVRVMGCMLRDVPELREALRERIRERHWGVVNLSCLRPFVTVSEDVCSAARILNGIIRENYIPVNRIIDAARARAQEIQGLSGRLREGRMSWAQGLGRLLETLAGVMERGNKRPAVLRRRILNAHTFCRSVGDRFVSTVPTRRGGNVIQEYLENL